MTEHKLLLPQMGESVAEATIIHWLKEEGDSIELDESVVEIANRLKWIPIFLLR